MQRLFLLTLFCVISISLFSQTEEKFSVEWDNALKVESADKQFQIKMGGRMQYDMMFISQDDTLANHFEANNGSEFRRVRLYTSGKIYHNIEFKVQLDFAKGSVVLKDVYMRFTKIPVVGNIQMGNFKEPMSFEMLTSSNNITEIERSLTEAFTPERSLGLMLFNHWANSRVSAFAGFFYNSNGAAKYQGNAYHLTGRLVGVPLYKNGSAYKVIHLGMSYSHQFQDGANVSYNVVPEAHLAPKYISAEFDQVQFVNKLGAEFVVVYKQFTFQSEYINNELAPMSGSVLTKATYGLNAWYGTFSWLVTGEHRDYNMMSGAFDKVVPMKNVGKEGGFGAFELSVRYSEISLDAHEIQGGKMHDITAGANWYLNPVTRISANYISSDVVGLGRAGIFELRFQLVF